MRWRSRNCESHSSLRRFSMNVTTQSGMVSVMVCTSTLMHKCIYIVHSYFREDPYFNGSGPGIPPCQRSRVQRFNASGTIPGTVLGRFENQKTSVKCGLGRFGAKVRPLGASGGEEIS